ncbi:MAG: cell division protein ZapA [Nitrospiraceae bacterium]|nr:cell division protein ZapA [Nitrospiraceae bacterium]
MGSIDVTILGQKYTIKGDASEEHIKKLATYVNGKLKDVYSSAPGITPLKAAILASMNIADELHKLKEEQEHIAKNINERADVLTSLFD